MERPRPTQPESNRLSKVKQPNHEQTNKKNVQIKPISVETTPEKNIKEITIDLDDYCPPDIIELCSKGFTECMCSNCKPKENILGGSILESDTIDI